MISADYARTMAAYNQWQNRNLYQAADGLSDAERRAPRGAFFGSIHATLNHLLWADQMWLSRLAGTPPPKANRIAASVAQFDHWQELKRERAAFDQRIIDWAASLNAEDLGREYTWFSRAVGKEMAHPVWLLVVHLFNHQTHHRGQVHAMLTAAGAKPGDTDLCLMEKVTA